MSANSDRRWSLARATEFFSGDGKPDMLDIRGMTAVTKGAAGKRDKFRKSVSRCGVSIYGPKHSAASATDSSSREKIYIEDPRAPCLNIDYSNDAYRLLPSSEKFSAHTGVCQILGTKCIRGGKHRIRVGDIIRFGSVGLLVSEIDTGGNGPNDATLSPSEVNTLIQRVVCHDEALADVDSGLDTDDDIGDASGNDESKPRASLQRQSTSAVCYVCYDETEDENPLIAPCKCSGDTKYIHLNCLKRWNTNGEKNEICTVLDESNARTCSICKAPYPSKTRLPNGKVLSLLPDRLNPPCIMFQVVTKHSSSTLNLSTRYQLSCKMLMDNDIHRPLMVGRSSQCDLVLKYRTVSTIHAEIHYSKGEFFLKDAGSSNGTLRYIYRPLTLHNNQSLHVKFGRTVLSIKPTKKIRLPHFFGTAGHLHAHGSRLDESGIQDDDELSNHSTPRNNRIRYNHAAQPPVSMPPQLQQQRQNLQTQMQNLDL
ncbi:fha domain protein [Plasmopara halstedii]|uniref:Fha domain protein n=1 Tax=Plasmopara halstedii TaxID=4781 RepID=A0A0P1AIU1_PLAHL|nr:fha domain protein [Plasmopara halstedii]CEG40429.1 fha domain protein [Plasmopara halstedii]|eukprot:XP_024576798.1 fha domain protein [Plasmopara halstedii]